jgi:periplasmic protein TonB
MPTRALLLSSDEKALAAVTQILRELGVSFEHFPEPASAGKSLASQHFEVILVDCDNQQNATLAFDSVRKSSINQNSMTIAIVDGKGGVPYAFRLGARLVLTKPLSLEQARGTLRNALAIQRREVPESKAMAAAARASAGPDTLSPFANAAESIPAAPSSNLSPGLPGLNPAFTVQVDAQPQAGIAASPLARAASAGAGARGSETAAFPSPAVPAADDAFYFKKEPTTVAPPKLARGADRSPEDDDLLLCELEEDLGARRKPSAISTRTRGARRKTSPSLLALLALLLVGAAFYAAWTMKPGFRDATRGEYARLHLLVTGRDTNPQTVAAPPKPVPKPNPSPAATAAKPSTPGPQASAPASAPTGTPIAEGFQSAQNTAAEGSQRGDAAGKPAPSSVLLPTSATRNASSDGEPVEVAAEYSDEHVSHRVTPIYPEKARHKRLEGDVLLQASVNEDGSVESVQVLDGNPQLVAAAVEAVRQWRYETYYHNGQPAAFRTDVTVRFELPKKPAH